MWWTLYVRSLRIECKVLDIALENIIIKMKRWDSCEDNQKKYWETKVDISNNFDFDMAD